MKKPMRRYRADDMPVLCAECGGRLWYDPDRFAWAHKDKGSDHAPRLVGSVQR